MNSPTVPSLENLCISVTVSNLERGYWNRQPWYIGRSREDNPFCCLIPSVVEAMVCTIYYRFWKRRMRRDLLPLTLSEQLRPLLLSSRIEHLAVFLLQTPESGTEGILTLLADNCERLKYLRLVRYPFVHKPILPQPYIFSEEIRTVLISATQLRQITTDTYFDFTILRNLSNLCTVEFDGLAPRFVDLVSLHNEMPLRNSSSVRYIYITNVTDMLWSNPIPDVAYALANLPNLYYIQKDIAEALDLIHGSEVDAGVEITTRYKLKKALFSPTSTRQIKIFSVTCPDVYNLHLTFRNCEMMRLCEMYLSVPNVTRLVLLRSAVMETLTPSTSEGASIESSINEWLRRTTIRSLLSKIEKGKLKSLKIRFALPHINFDSLQFFTPTLTKLYLMVVFASQSTGLFPVHFPCLTHLVLSFKVGVSRLSDETWFLITSPPNLQFLTMFNARQLTDDLLDKILQRNKLSNLKFLNLSYCQLTERSLRKVLEQCRNLESVVFLSITCSLSKRQLRDIGLEINPRVSVCNSVTFNPFIDTYKPRPKHIHYV